MTLRVFGCGSHYNELFLIHGIKQDINLFAATAFSLTTIYVDKLVYRDVEHSNKFDENFKTRVLPFVLNIHYDSGSTPYKF